MDMSSYFGTYETWQLGALAMREPRFEKFAEAARALCGCDPYYEWKGLMGNDPIRKLSLTRICGAYRMPDGREFWLDEPVGKEILSRLSEANT